MTLRDGASADAGLLSHVAIPTPTVSHTFSTNLLGAYSSCSITLLLHLFHPRPLGRALADNSFWGRREPRLYALPIRFMRGPYLPALLMTFPKLFRFARHGRGHATSFPSDSLESGRYGLRFVAPGQEPAQPSRPGNRQMYAVVCCSGLLE